MAIQLQMNFKNRLGKNFRINVDDALENLTDAQVKSAMDTIIAKNIFNTSGGDVVEIVGAELVSTTTKGFTVK
ncbi:DUF2922 domain-containing protein [Aceticella autotrophica]|jgi:hypothetical protein|uniref:DUF2922 domain-containing protein n=1 Tax=Aceticella autotrophica TaxID=2755338 RepID=A0A975AWE7_9THEO|nr:DUF2922 domain-containing protein [Aceticella autotrophica]MDI6605407.1 DUF2922 domain-containing protein [Thermoanaerobacteraceae bacterium]QSZ27689.1 DUF2922 domain-containing protein [Aceticella autotrophica]